MLHIEVVFSSGIDLLSLVDQLGNLGFGTSVTSRDVGERGNWENILSISPTSECSMRVAIDVIRSFCVLKGI